MSVNIGNDIQEWLDSLKEDSIPALEDMPSNGLLMEQTIKYLQKILEPYSCVDEEKLITSYMINNYVKDGTIPSPDKKKYSREHLAYLISICLLKQVVSLDEPLNVDSEGNELVLFDLLPSENDCPQESMEKSTEKQILWKVINKLNQREKEIMVLRFGLSGGEELTQKEVADSLGISQSYISRLEKKIVIRIKKEITKLA